MIGKLPTKLEVNGTMWPIRTDFRDVLNIFVAMSDPDLKEKEKWFIALKILYPTLQDMKEADYSEAAEKAAWFLSLGNREEKKNLAQLYDWEKDEQIIFPAVNKIAGREVRELEYLHFWTFMGYFFEIGEGTFSMIVGIRSKKVKGKKLEDYEKEFYYENKSSVDIKKISAEQQAEIDFLNKLLG